MPELPEVETIKNQLRPLMPFKVEQLHWSKVATSLFKRNKPQLEGRTLTNLRRHGKFLIFDLDNGTHLISHLGMTGQWRIDSNASKEKHCHLLMRSSTGRVLAYVDPRRFGKMLPLSSEELSQYLLKHPVDVSSDALTLSYLKELFKKYPTRQLKPFLLEQKFFAGLGNYMASEICAHASVRPTRRLGKIRSKEQEKILHATQLVVSGAIASGGVTFQGGYIDAEGNKGLGVQGLVVFYQKICQLCQKTPIKKIILAQRGTYYCPHCQK
jgi:formamidopyrimidine-DNA glycosylase